MDYSLCIICQKAKAEELRCPASHHSNSVLEETYRIFLSDWECFRAAGISVDIRLPLSLATIETSQLAMQNGTHIVDPAGRTDWSVGRCHRHRRLFRPQAAPLLLLKGQGLVVAKRSVHRSFQTHVCSACNRVIPVTVCTHMKSWSSPTK